jgi:hypothetical protein
MPTKKEMQLKNSQESNDNQILEMAIFGIALGITVGAIAQYIKNQNEKNKV